MMSQQAIDVARRGKEFYDQSLRATLEAQHLNEYVAVEPDSGDFYIGKSENEAIQTARAVHPDCLTFVTRIGHSVAVDMDGAQL